MLAIAFKQGRKGPKICTVNGELLERESKHYIKSITQKGDLR